MGRDLIPADVAWKGQSATMGADVSLDLLCNIIQFDTLCNEG